MTKLSMCSGRLLVTRYVLHRQMDYVSFESERRDSKDNNKNSDIREIRAKKEYPKGRGNPIDFSREY